MKSDSSRLATPILLSLCILILAVSECWGAPQAGDVDTSFDPGWFILQSVYAFAVQPDGKILVGATSRTPTNRITRQTTGSLADATFTTTVSGGTGVRAVLLQPDGKVLIGGDFTSINGSVRSCVARLNADGSLDSSFVNPMVTGVAPMVLAIARQSDGKVLIGGLFDGVGGASRGNVARLNADGTLDAAFANGADGEVHALALQSDGKVLLGGAFTTVAGAVRPGVARLNADGTLDAAFANGTGGTNGAVDAVVQQTDGKILIAGDFTSVNGVTRNRVARLDAAGDLDPLFQAGMVGADNRVRALALQADGRIVIGGAFTTFDGVPWKRLARLDANGTLDTSWGTVTSAGVDDQVRTLALAGSTPIVGGDFSTINGNAAFRRAFGGLGPFGTFLGDGCLYGVALQPDGKVVRHCREPYTANTRRMVRWNLDGSLDSTFSATVSGFVGPTPPLVFALAQQPDGKVLIAGQFASVNGSARRCLGRVNADGSLDAGFPNLDIRSALGRGSVDSIALQPDGKILIGGFFVQVGGVSRTGFARLNADGTLDTGFLRDGEADRVSAIALQPDGKIVVLSSSASNIAIKRLKPDGSLDPAFTTFTYSGAEGGLALQPGNKALTIVNGAIVRLNADGSVDASFQGATPPHYYNGLAVQPDGKILVTFSPSTSGRAVARLNEDGTLDPSFRIGLSAEPLGTLLSSLIAQPDGNALLAMNYRGYDGVRCGDMVRIVGNVPPGDDPDGDGILSPADDCPYRFDPSQSDADGDGEGDPCDTNDGLLWEWREDRGSISYDFEQGVSSWNVYVGDLEVMKATGVYTQPPASNPLASRQCGVTTVRAPDPAIPPTGDVSFSLVTAVTGGGEGSLGSSTTGERPNTNPCP